MNADRDEFAKLPNGIDICYRDEGSGEPIVLIIGLSFQLIHWPRELISALIAGGHRVITFDNRDSGRSSYVTGRGPNLREMIFRKAPKDAYTLDDMSDDMLALMDHMGIDRAHFVGMSLGGMIAQVTAVKAPERVLSLTSIFSTTGARRVGQPSFRVAWQMSKKAARDRDTFIEHRVTMSDLIGGKGFPAEPAARRKLISDAWERGGPTQYRGTARQLAAIFASGDRTRELKTIDAPTLVIHGDRDSLVHPSGGRATAAAIPNARHVTIEGMGHELPPAVAPRLAELILSHVKSCKAEQP
ncbi:alpha/beta fold hydrolase [Notoacmeibacter ruber]|uniref:Alpha/beta fold hydrolase n=1 Tax=Notoacmeibacter ruber TaxID=2670375 RepID=A0A3L7JBD9_9HYPH|nr:alpha/beta hydrolase [Notoacmeibacter ruber]RLQ86831.1 alpha/beta fold hydrolase [Notoacmeibacter ruber]